jgi:L-threonylcarbamoyladenylate synthase
MVILKPTREAMESAASAIRDGRVVAMPTETVYGLACSALNADAVARVFEIKGRPSDNPLIVHIASFADLRQVAASWPPAAEKLAARFWPGPLTMVLPKKDRVPDATTGGLDTVAVRIPRHPVALELIRLVGGPLAAPSANPFMGLSPTRAEDVDPAILVDVEMVLDGGPCEVGLESTVIDLSGEFPRILRPGGASRSDIQSVLGQPLGELPPPSVRRSPGMHPRHYAPNAVVEIVAKVEPSTPGLVFGSPQSELQIRMPRDPHDYGASLYAALKRLDQSGVPLIQVESPPQGQEWEAVNDRLAKASHPEFKG